MFLVKIHRNDHDLKTCHISEMLNAKDIGWSLIVALKAICSNLASAFLYKPAINPIFHIINMDPKSEDRFMKNFKFVV